MHKSSWTPRFVSKAQRFEVRLRDDLYNAMVVLRFPLYEEVLQKALIITKMNT